MRKKWPGIFVILTICFIWGNSLLPASMSREFSNFVRDALNRVLFATPGFEAIEGTALLRKIAHATEFAVLGIAVTLFIKRCQKRPISAVLLCGVLVALIDETIQIFAAGRGSQIRDVWIDILGFLLGSTICLGIFYIKNKLEQGKAARPYH